MNLKNTAIYIHIPFCDHKCIYCDFYSLVSYDNIDTYLKTLKIEIEYYAKQFAEGRTINTIFFGGGTPSFMQPEYIEDIIQTIAKNFNVASNVETTLETNPGTVTLEKLKNFKKAGINRISIGVQSFDEKELQFLTRIHDNQTAIDTINNAQKAGFNNISIDLIFSLPNQSKLTWQENLNIASDLPIQHISTYSLILERGTILNKMVIDGKVKMTSQNHDADLYKLTMEFLNDKGFMQYEVSNFAKNGYQCVHNLCYWEYKDYFGFGTSAHSFVGGKRWWNFSSLKKYSSEVNKNGNAVRGREELINTQMLDEIIMLGLRSKGINLNQVSNINNNWYFDKKEIIDSFIKESYVKLNHNLISCTPKGYLVCDELISQLV